MAPCHKIQIVSRLAAHAIIAALMLSVPLSVVIAAPAREKNPAAAYQKQIEAQCLTAQEAELVDIVNMAREDKGLAPIPVSSALVRVARTHALDLQENAPHKGSDVRGRSCNMHSWSSNGYWKPVCYTSDHFYAYLMRSKPAEITRNAFAGAGYEVVYWTSFGPVDPARALSGWLRSPAHRMMLLQTDRWAGKEFKSLGVGMSENFAALWISLEADSQEPMSMCEKGL